MDLLIISNYWHFECEKKSSRYLTVANMAADEGMEVEVVTSTFYHTSKKQRRITSDVLQQYAYKTTLISEPGYTQNIDPRRITSHHKFAENVVHYLRTRKKPSVIYLFVPSLSLGSKVIEFANSNNIPVIIDVLDLWPEAFGMLSPFPKLTLTALYSMKKKANDIYKNADGVIAVSETYLNRVMSVNTKCRDPKSVYIGIELGVFDSAIENYKKDDSYVDIVYIGMLGKSYDLKCAIDALAVLKQNGMTNLRLIVMGDGPLRNEFESYAEEKQINYVFTGRLPYEKMVSRLVKCDIALNVISHGAVQSIINKHADYLAAGLPIINNQEIAEFGDLLTEYQCGINCPNGDVQSLANAIRDLAVNDELRVQMGKKARSLAENKFNRENTYKNILGSIKKWRT